MGDSKRSALEKVYIIFDTLVFSWSNGLRRLLAMEEVYMINTEGYQDIPNIEMIHFGCSQIFLNWGDSSGRSY